MNGKNLQSLIKNLQIFYKCPSCGSAYKHEDITFLGRVDEHCFMQLTCKACSLPILATVLLSSKFSEVDTTKQTKPVVYKSDLTQKEARTFASSTAISANEICDLYIYLSDNTVNFSTSKL